MTFSPTEIHAFKIHQGKIVISSITGRHLYLQIILHVIRMSLVFCIKLHVTPMSPKYHFYVTRVSIVCTRMSFVM